MAPRHTKLRSPQVLVAKIGPIAVLRIKESAFISRRAAAASETRRSPLTQASWCKAHAIPATVYGMADLLLRFRGALRGGLTGEWNVALKGARVEHRDLAVTANVDDAEQALK